MAEDSAARAPAVSRRDPTDGGGAPGSRSRNFGPDAPPKNKRKPQRKDEGRPKGPIKARPVTTLYDEDEDWRAQDEDDVEIDNVATSKADEAEEVDDRSKKTTRRQSMLTHVKVLAVLFIVLGALCVLSCLSLMMVFGGAAGSVGVSGDPDAAVALPIIGFAGPGWPSSSWSSRCPA